MKIWRFSPLAYDRRTCSWSEPKYWSSLGVKRGAIAFSEADMHAKLNGRMAEIVDPGKSLIVRLWRRLFPLRVIEVDA